MQGKKNKMRRNEGREDKEKERLRKGEIREEIRKPLRKVWEKKRKEVRMKGRKGQEGRKERRNRKENAATKFLDICCNAETNKSLRREGNNENKLEKKSRFKKTEDRREGEGDWELRRQNMRHRNK